MSNEPGAAAGFESGGSSRPNNPHPHNPPVPFQQTTSVSSAAPLTWLPAAQPAPDPSLETAHRAHRIAQTGEALYRAGNFRAALQKYYEAVRLKPDEAAYHYRLVHIAEVLNETQLMEHHLLETVRLKPDFALAHNSLAHWYRKVGGWDLALKHSEVALALEPANQDFVITRGIVLMAMGRPEDAWTQIEPLIAQGASQKWLAWLYARIAPTIGQESQALAALQRALQAPGLPLTANGKPLLHFAASALLDRMGNYDEAFKQARLANEMIASTRPPYDPQAHAQWISSKIRHMTRRRMQSLPRAIHDDRRPVFIVGMPRSGTSLVEQILASHPAVFGAGELNALARIARGVQFPDWAEGSHYPEALDALSLRRAGQLASEYLSAISALDTTAAYVTDKLPDNFLHLDLIELLFPQCKIIHCVRDPLDTSLSCYFTNFSGGHAFKHKLSDLGAYHADYRRLMEHWGQVLSLPILEVRYEDVVLDTEAQARRMLEFLGLPWDERCLKFYENARHVKTASDDQVRRPIYASSIGRWKHYEPHLSELIAAVNRLPGAAA